MNNFQISIRLFVVALFTVSFTGVKSQDTIGTNAIKTYTLQKYPRYDRFENKDHWKRTFLQLQVGSTALLNSNPFQNLIKNSSFNTGIAIGYWITPLHGIRTGATFQLYDKKEYGKSFVWRTDYLMNLSALCLGYDRSRIFELVGTVGLEYVHSKYQGETHNDLGLKAGLQGRVKTSQYAVLYLEPALGIYTDHVKPGTSWRKYDLAASLTAGLEYRPSPIEERNHDEFIEKQWSDHIFLYTGVGGGFRIKRSGSISDNLGGTLLLGAGKWFNPYSGIRISGKGSIFRNIPHKRYLAVGAQADYLLNFSNLLSGYRADRDYYVYVPIGLNLDITNSQDAKKVQWGFGIGMQAAFKLNSNIEYYIEPRFNLYTFNQGMGYTILDSDLNFLLSTGFNFIHVPEIMQAYRARLKQYRKVYSKTELSNEEIRKEIQEESNTAFKERKTKPISPKWYALDHIFAGAGIDVSLPLNSSNFYKEKLNPKGAMWAGIWLNPYSGLRGYTEIGYSYRSSKKNHIKSADLGIDYLWNISNTVLGRNDSRRFELVAGAGANLLFFNSTLDPCYLGGSLSLQGIYHINDHIGLFLEPRLRIYSNEMAQGQIPLLHTDAVISGLAGVNFYFPARTSWKSVRNNEDKENSQRFISISGGGQFLLQNPDGIGPVGEIMLGKWKNSMYGWRFGLFSEYRTERHKKYAFGGIGGDYLLNLSTLTNGSNPFRKVNIIGLAGVQMGIDPKMNKLRFGLGGRIGGQLSVALSPNVSIYAQPTLTFRRIFREDYETKNMLLPAIQLGVNYGMKQSERSQNSSSPTDKKNFLSASYGLGFYSETFRYDSKLHSTMRLSAGRWISPISGIRGNLTYRNPESKRGKARIQSFGIGGDYLMNLSNWIAGENEDRRFEIIPNIGIHVDFNSLKDRKNSTTLGARGGILLNYKLSKQYNLFIEPSINVLENSFDRSFGRSVKGLAELEVGAQYKF